MKDPKAATLDPPLLSIADVQHSLRVGRRLVERLIASGRFPKADLYVGRLPRWRQQTLDRWIEQGGKFEPAESRVRS